jgi:hypothetical protein
MKTTWSLLLVLLLLAAPAAVQAQFTYTTNNGAITETRTYGISSLRSLQSLWLNSLGYGFAALGSCAGIHGKD